MKFAIVSMILNIMFTIVTYHDKDTIFVIEYLYILQSLVTQLYCYKTSVWTDFRVRVSGQK